MNSKSENASSISSTQLDEIERLARRAKERKQRYDAVCNQQECPSIEEQMARHEEWQCTLDDMLQRLNPDRVLALVQLAREGLAAREAKLRDDEIIAEQLSEWHEAVDAAAGVPKAARAAEGIGE